MSVGAVAGAGAGAARAGAARAKAAAASVRAASPKNQKLPEGVPPTPQLAATAARPAAAWAKELARATETRAAAVNALAELERAARAEKAEGIPKNQKLSKGVPPIPQLAAALEKAEAAIEKSEAALKKAEAAIEKSEAAETESEKIKHFPEYEEPYSHYI